MEDRDNLDDTYSGLEMDSDTEPRPSRLGLIAVLIGVAAAVIGVGGMVMANSAQKEVAALRAELDNRPDRTVDFEARLDEMEQRLVNLGSELVRLNRADRQIRDEVQGAIESMAREVRQNRQSFNDVTGKLEEMAQVMEGRPAGTTAVTRTTTDRSAAAGASGEPAADMPEDGYYIIQAGDTFSGLASRFGISLSQLIQANPEANPNRLQIGQRIRIPR